MKIDFLRAYGIIPVVIVYIATLVFLTSLSNFVTTLGKKEEYIFHDKFVGEIIYHIFESC